MLLSFLFQNKQPNETKKRCKCVTVDRPSRECDGIESRHDLERILVIGELGTTTTMTKGFAFALSYLSLSLGHDDNGSIGNNDRMSTGNAPMQMNKWEREGERERES